MRVDFEKSQLLCFLCFFILGWVSARSHVVSTPLATSFPTPTPGPNVLECVFNVVCNGNDFVCGKNKENFYNNDVLLSPRPIAPAPVTQRTTAIILNGIDNGIIGNNILKGVLNVMIY